MDSPDASGVPATPQPVSRIVVEMLADTTIRDHTAVGATLPVKAGAIVRLPLDVALPLIRAGVATIADQRAPVTVDWLAVHPQEQQAYRERLYWAARDLAARGWPVLPGSAWTPDSGYVTPDGRLTDGLTPLVPVDHASTLVARIYQWWREDANSLVPTLLMPAGRAFDVWSVDLALGTGLLARTSAGPVIFNCAYGRMYFLVTLRLGVSVDLGTDRATLLPRGTCIPVPPTEVEGTGVRWMIHPSVSSWRPAPFDAVCGTVLRVLRACPQ